VQKRTNYGYFNSDSLSGCRFFCACPPIIQLLPETASTIDMTSSNNSIVYEHSDTQQLPTDPYKNVTT